MRKYFLSLTMVLLGLLVGVSTMKAINTSGMTLEEAETMAFWARLTAKPATTTNGSGKVFVVAKDSYEGDPTDGQYAAVSHDDGWSDIFLASSFINADVAFWTYAKADDGSYLAGWSFTDGYTDLGSEKSNFSIDVTPSSKKAHANIREYIIYAAFLPVQLVSYDMVGGSQELADDGAGNWTCTQIIRFRAETPGFEALSSSDDERHFKLPTVARKAGTTGTWNASISNISYYGDYAELTVPVTFIAPNGDAGEYAATLTLETKAGVKMTVYLYARRSIAGEQAIRYNKSKVQLEAGNLTDLLAHATTDDIIKLNGDYSSPVEISKNITFDLNGFTLNNTLTVSGGNVTLAYSAFGGSADALNVTGGKAILDGGTFASMTIGASGAVEQNGATISGLATNNGSLTTTDGKFEAGLTSSKTLVVNGGTFDGNIAINITGGTAQIKKGAITGNTFGIQSAGTTTIEKLASVFGYTKALKCTGGSLTINNGKFYDPMDLIEDDPVGSFIFNAGYFKNNGTEAPTAFGKQIWRNTAGAEARAGYAYFAGSQDAAQASNVSVCRIGHTSYSSLEDALAFANNSGQDVIIIMENNYTLKAGFYTLPSNATLIVPMSNDQNAANPVVPRESDLANAVSFRKLIFESGVNLTVQGTFELSGTQYGSGADMGVPGGNYGHLILKPGSHMVINNGGELRAWGFVTGDGTKDAEGNYLSGEIDARRGAIVREMFQMGDWKGGDISLTMVMPLSPYSDIQDKTHLFPIYAYFIQNIESPVKYHPGASLLCAASVNVSGAINAYANDIKVVGKEGEAAMFLMDEMADAENTWVRKYYDAKNDKQVYEVNSGAQLGSMVIDLGEVPGMMFGGSGMYAIQLDSRKFVLPLTNNFKIHLLSGNMQFTQSTSCLPGMEVEIDKESEISIIKNESSSVVSGALYLYDADQWSYKGKGYVGNSGHFGEIVRYSATWDLGTKGAQKRSNVRNVTSPAAIGDAILNVHGTFRMEEGCAVYTSWAKDDTKLDFNAGGTGGAKIVSTNEDAGTFIFDDDAPAIQGITFDADHEGEFNLDYMTFGQNCLVNYDHNDHGEETDPKVYPIHQRTVLGSDARIYGWELFTSAKLMNKDGSFVSTEGTEGGMSFCFMDDHWANLEVDACFMKDNVTNTYYAKPREYVALASNTPNEDHTYSDKAGAGRLFILLTDEMGSCLEWWEVEKKDNLYHCIHPENDTYYYWDDSKHRWMEKRFTITWLNWDGTEIKSYIDNGDGPQEVEYSVTYGTMAEFLGSNPTRDADIDYTYNFTGWSPALGKVTSDVTYTATYEKQQRKFTIIFQEEGGVEIERHFLTHNETPVCENVPTKAGHTLVWSPAIAAVTGDATYRATWEPEPPTEYDVIFFDYDGKTELQNTKVAVGEMPVAPADPSGKPATNEFTYKFDHWSPALEAVSATSIKSYTAIYVEELKPYTISYFKEDGKTPNATKPSEILSYGATPTPPSVTKENPEPGHTYTLVWKTLDEKNGIQTVKGNASYKPMYLDVINKYEVKLQCNIPGKATFEGAGIYNFGSSINVSASIAEGYTFDHWEGIDWTGPDGTIASLESDMILTLYVTDGVVVPDLEVAAGEELTIEPDTKCHDFILNSDGTESASVTNADNLEISGKCYYDLTQTFEAARWYAVAVPWEVVAGEIQADGVTLSWNSGNYLASYNGQYRADHGKTGSAECWNYATNGEVLVPGRLYMLYLQSGAAKLRFPKKAGSKVSTTSTSVSTYAEATDNDGKDANWNGIANPATYKAYLNAGATDGQGQVYNAVTEQYELFEMDDDKLIVGQPIFVQAPVAKTVVADGSGYNSSAAPKRRVQGANSTARYDVRLSAEDKQADRLIIRINEDKEENRYVIGQDLVKFGVSTKVAQMWIDRYDAKLCVNTVAPEGETTFFPLGIFAPKAGEYQISNHQSAINNDYTLYLTYNGEAIWNLSEDAYTLNLEKGTYTNYGLRVSARAPQVTTGIDEAVIDAKGETRKVLMDNNVYIIRGEKVYSIDGQLVK